MEVFTYNSKGYQNFTENLTKTLLSSRETPITQTSKERCNQFVIFWLNNNFRKEVDLELRSKFIEIDNKNYSKTIQFLLMTISFYPEEKVKFIKSIYKIIHKINSKTINKDEKNYILIKLTYLLIENEKHEPDHYRQLIYISRRFLQSSDFFEKVIKESLERFPDLIEFKMEYLNTFLYFNKINEVNCEELLDFIGGIKDPNNLGGTLVNVLYQTGMKDRAHRILNDLLKEKPDEFEYIKQKVLIASKEYNKTVLNEIILKKNSFGTKNDRTLKINLSTFFSKFNFWISLILSGKTSEEVLNYHKAALKFNNSKKYIVYINTIRALLNLKDNEEADRIWDQLVTKGMPDCNDNQSKFLYEDFYYLLGYLYVWKKDYVTAREQFELALIQKNPGKLGPLKKMHCHLAIANLYELEGKIDQAENYLNQLMDSPNIKKSIAHKIYLAWINFMVRTGRKEIVLRETENILEKYSDSDHILIRIGQLYSGYDEDYQYNFLCNAYEKFKLNPELMCELARIHMNPCAKRYDLKKAEMFLSEALQLNIHTMSCWVELIKVKMLLKCPQEEIDRLIDVFSSLEFSNGSYFKIYGFMSGQSGELIKKIISDLHKHIKDNDNFYSNPKVGKEYQFFSFALPALNECLEPTPQIDRENILVNRLFFLPNIEKWIHTER
jgi:tetratricopeptide (TPR) repeat protein